MLVSETFAAFDLHILQYQGKKLKTRKNYRSACNSFINSCGDVPIELISLDVIVRWKIDLERSGKVDATIKTMLLQLRAVLRFAEQRGIKVISWRDISMPRVKRKSYTWLNYDEVQSIIEAAMSERDKAIIACLFSTGCRISELLNLNISDVLDSDEPTVCGKGDKYRTVFIDQTARKYLNDYLNTRHDNYKPLFMSGQRARITVSRVEQIVHEAANRAGIDKNVTPHVFRHSTITDYILNGASMPIVQQIAGHASIQTTVNIYTHIQNEDKRQAFHQFHSSKHKPLDKQSAL